MTPKTVAEIERLRRQQQDGIDDHETVQGEGVAAA